MNDTSQKRYDDIAFHFTNGWLCEYKRWAEGERVSIQGNRTSWYKATTPDYSYATFRKYLNLVFNYAGTLSLSKELKSINLKDMHIGDVFIHGGSPGHAMIVIDAVQNPKDSTDKTLVVAEGYMPAQDMHIVLNNRGDENTPWWSTLTMLQDGAIAFTTYWFDIDDTKTFKK